MTGTQASDIYDLFMQLIYDYQLIELYQSSPEDLTTYLQSWLLFSIEKFDICNQSLEFDSDTNYFSETLNTKNKTMLAQFMVEFWLQKVTQDRRQMDLHVQDRDFKIYSEGQNLREKSAHLDKVRELTSQMLIDYGYKNADWSTLAQLVI